MNPVNNITKMHGKGTYYFVNTGDVKIKCHLLRAQDVNDINAINNNKKKYEVRFYGSSNPYRKGDMLEVFHENSSDRAICKIESLQNFASHNAVFTRVNPIHVFPNFISIADGNNMNAKASKILDGLNSNKESTNCTAMKVKFLENVCLPPPAINFLTHKYEADREDLKNIASGEKTLFGRVFRFPLQLIALGDHLEIFPNDESEQSWGVVCKITSLDFFKCYEDMFAELDASEMFPQLLGDRKVEDGIKKLRKEPCYTDIHKLGCVAIGVKFISKMHKPKMQERARIV